MFMTCGSDWVVLCISKSSHTQKTVHMTVIISRDLCIGTPASAVGCCKHYLTDLYNTSDCYTL